MNMQQPIKVHSRIVSRFETVDKEGNKKIEKYTSGRKVFIS